MSPGVNDGPRNTGTVPKSNRRNDRNRERNSAVNQFANRSAYHRHAQHSNNLFTFDWKPVSEREAPRIAKNSNTRSISSAPSTSYQDISEFASHNCGRQYNYSSEELAYWQKMVTPAESRTQSPPRVQTNKRSNVDKMPDRGQIESRLNQIRDYIRASSNMMDQLSQSNDPLAQAQHEKLGKMVEDLHDSERKLSKLLELSQNCGIFDQNGEIVGAEVDENGDTREVQLRKKMEESQRKIAQLQEHQANLVGMQLRLRMQLTEARQAQEVLLQHENSEPTTPPPIPLPSKVEQLENETLALKGKLAQLQSKKKHMDHFVAELQALEMSDRASCSSDGSRNFVGDKAAELEAMKAQVAHLKALMEQATRVRECGDDASEPEADVDVNGESAEDPEPNEEENATNISFDRQSDSDDISNGKVTNTDDRPTVDKIQAITRELREQATLLQNTRAELQRLKQPVLSSTLNSDSSSAYPNFNPPPSLTPSTNSENKQTKTCAPETQPAQEKRRQFEDFMRKDSYQESSVNCDVAAAEVNSHRSSSSHVSHTSNPANIWPPPAIIGSSEQNGDTASPSEHLLDMGGPQPPAIENGFHGSWWPYPVPPMNQLQHGSAEYYRQLVLGSQAQQLQMMGMTLQQCCQLLASQQRELQSMRSAITQLQMQLRQQNQLAQRANNVENQEDYSNLSRNAHHLGEGLDGTLPPSSSLPNLVSLPNSSPAMSHSAVASTSTQHQQQQQQQLNNQVPPGNRANNYWDNFRR